MNDDYLWDKSGEPDPEIQKLEEILGTLRYQPKALSLPVESRRRRNYFVPLAIAATIVMALLAGALWTRVQTQDASIPEIAIAQPPAKPDVPKMDAPPLKVDTQPNQSLIPTPVSHATRKQHLARHDRREALAAKQQLMFALRLASEKLNAASRRTQHKAG